MNRSIRYTNLAGSLKSVIENGPMLSSHDQTYLKCFSNNNLKTSALKVVVKRTVQDVKGTKWYCSNSERKAIWNKAVEAILENLTRSEPHCSYLTECLKPVLPSLIPNGKFRPLSNLMTVEVKYDVQPRPVQKLPSTTSYVICKAFTLKELNICKIAQSLTMSLLNAT